MSVPLPPAARVVNVAEGVWETAFPLPADGVGFPGHFPDEPVLPGMCHVAFAVAAAAAILGRAVTLREVERARFLRRVPPGGTLVVRVSRRAAGGAGIAFEARHAVDGEDVAEVRFVVS